MKKIRVFLLLFCFIILGVNNTIYAEAETNIDIIQPRYAYIKNHSATLTISNNQANAATRVTSLKACDLSITMKLQKKSGSSWITVKTWTTSKENATILTLNKTYAVGSGTYRVYSTVSAAGEKAYPTSLTVTN